MTEGPFSQLMDHGIHMNDILSQHSDKMHGLLFEALGWGQLGYTQAGPQRRDATLENVETRAIAASSLYKEQPFTE